MTDYHTLARTHIHWTTWVIPLVISVVAGIATVGASYYAASMQRDVELLKLTSQIIQDAKSPVGLKLWAVGELERHSGTPIPPDARSKMIEDIVENPDITVKELANKNPLLEEMIKKSLIDNFIVTPYTMDEGTLKKLESMKGWDPAVINPEGRTVEWPAKPEKPADLMLSEPSISTE